MSSLQDLLNPFRNSPEKKLDRNNARALIDYIEKHGKEIGFDAPVDVYRIIHDIPNAGGGFHEGRGVLALTDGMMKKVLGSPNLNSHVPLELKALVGHEMSHMKDMSRGIDSVFLRKVPLFGLPLLAMGGYILWTNAQKRHQEDPSKTIPEHLEDITEAEKQKSLAKDEPSYHIWEGSFISWASKVALVGGIGLAAGGLAARHMSLAAEFRADRAAVLASGCKPKVFMDMLNKTEKQMGSIMSKRVKDWQNTMSQRGFWENVKDIYQIIKHDLVATTLHAHPTNAQRARAMEEFAKQQGSHLI